MLSPKSYLNFFIRFYFFATTTDTTESPDMSTRLSAFQVTGLLCVPKYTTDI